MKKKKSIDKGMVADMLWRVCITVWVAIHTFIN